MQEQITITLPSGKTAKLRGYVTGRIKRDMKEALLAGAEITAVGGDTNVKGLKPTAMADAENVAISKLVLELDGKAEDILNRVLDLPLADFDFLVGKINEITDGKGFLAD